MTPTWAWLSLFAYYAGLVRGHNRTRDKAIADLDDRSQAGFDRLQPYGECPDRTGMFLARTPGKSNYLAALDAIPDATTRRGARTEHRV